MRLDMELIRKIIFTLEDHEHGYAPSEMHIEGYTKEQIDYHAYQMMEFDLVEGVKTADYHSSSPQAIIKNLTWRGHEFAAAARNETIWNKSQSIVKEKGGTISIGVFTQLLTSIAKAHFGLP